jgi:PrtD family type I secretion system ABC transporter
LAGKGLIRQHKYAVDIAICGVGPSPDYVNQLWVVRKTLTRLQPWERLTRGFHGRAACDSMSTKAAGKGEVASTLLFSRGALISVFLFSCLVNILMLTGPVFMLQVYDRVLTSGSVPTLVALSAIVLVLYLYYGFLEHVRGRVMHRVARRFEETLRPRVFDAMAKMALHRVPGIGGQPLADLQTVRQFVGGQGPLAFFDMPWVPAYLFIIFSLHAWLGAAGLVAAIFIFCLALLTERSTKAPLSEASTTMSRASLLTDEVRRNAEAMHALGMRAALRKKWEGLQQQALDQHTEASDKGGRYSAMSKVVRLLVQSGILALGAYLAVKGEISPGTIIAASIIMGRGLAPIEQAVGNWQQFQGYRKASQRLSDVLEKVPPEGERMTLPPPKGLLEVENLSVVLKGTQKPVLQGLSFKVEPGQGLGVIGPTGAGKSTLARVLAGLIEPTAGSVRLDGATPDQRTSEELGLVIGYLPQDVQLFDGTVAQNISRFVEKPDPKEIVAAARMADVHDMIMRLPKGYDTPLGENASRLSAGQRQRVALARALYGNPAMLVMDEPNSNLDADGEAALDRAIRATLARGACVVVAAHRPSALHAIHGVLVLSDGKQVAYGPRDEVLKKVTRPTQPQQPSHQQQRLPPVEAAGPQPLVSELRN